MTHGLNKRNFSMMETNNNNAPNVEVAILQNDVKNFSILLAKMDITIEKVVDYSNNIGKLVSLAEQRLINVHENNEHLSNRVDDITKHFLDGMKDLHEHIRANNKDLERTIKDEIKLVSSSFSRENEKTNDRITILKLELQEEMDKTNTDIKKRLSTLEGLKWLIMGGAAVIGYLINKIPFNIFIQ